MPDVELPLRGRWRRLEDGSWGAAIPTTTLYPGWRGRRATLVRRDGSETEVTLGGLTAAASNSVAVYRIARRLTEERPAEAVIALPVPSDATRPGRMLLAGGIKATVTLPDREHVTLHVRARRRNPSNARWENCGLADRGALAKVRAGRSGTVIGTIYPVLDSANPANLRSVLGVSVVYRSGVSEAVKNAVYQLFRLASGDGGGWYEGYLCVVADRCGRCGRELTDPISIDRGIGPECYGRSTGSRHAEVTEPQNTGTLRVTPLRSAGQVRLDRVRAAREARQRLREERERQRDAENAEAALSTPRYEDEADRVKAEREAAKEAA